MSTTKKYWKGIEELHNEAAVQDLAKNEFPEDVATADFLGEQGNAESTTSRRDFLKFMGFSTAAATLAACETPVQKVIPYDCNTAAMVHETHPSYAICTHARLNLHSISHPFSLLYFIRVLAY